MCHPTFCLLLTICLIVIAIAGTIQPAAISRSTFALALVPCLLQPILSDTLQQHQGTTNCALPLLRCVEDLGNGLCRTTNDLCDADPGSGLEGDKTDGSAGSKSGTPRADMACAQEGCPNQTIVLDPPNQSPPTRKRRQPREKAHILKTLKNLVWLVKFLFPHRVLSAILGLARTLVQFSFIAIWRALVVLSKIVTGLLVVIWEDIIFPITFPARLLWWALIQKPIEFARLVYIKIRSLLVLLCSAMTVGGVIGMVGGFTHTFLANWLFPLRDAKVHQPLALGVEKTPAQTRDSYTPVDSGLESPSEDSSMLGELDWPAGSRLASARSPSSHVSSTKPDHAPSSSRQSNRPHSSRSGTTNPTRSRESSASSSSAPDEGSTLTTPSSKSSWVSIMKRNSTTSPPSSSVTSAGRKKVTFKTD